jgi:hypothetical protein
VQTCTCAQMTSELRFSAPRIGLLNIGLVAVALARLEILNLSLSR